MTAAPSRPDGPASSRDTPPGGPAPGLRPALGMQSISDVVFGLALSIGSVILISKLPATPEELGVDILAFGFNFLIVIIVWTGYRRAVVTLPHETRATVIVNLALLYAVAIEPFLYWVMFAGGTSMREPASMAYAVDVGSMILLQEALNFLLLAEERAAPRTGAQPIALERIRRRTWSGIAIGVLFLGSALPIFWVPAPGNSTLRIYFWYTGLALLFMLPRLLAREKESSEGVRDEKTAPR